MPSHDHRASRVHEKFINIKLEAKLDDRASNVAMEKCKTYSRRDSHVVTHRSTNLPVHSLSSGERTGSSAACDLWPYVGDKDVQLYT
jgi:hypothetical protein